jgi:tRNA(adenine34) deaminase
MKFSFSTVSINELERQIKSYDPDISFTHDVFSTIAVAEAVQAAKEGNIGVGGCVVKAGELIIRDRNRQFVPHFRSDLHAEMVIINQLEEMLRHESSPDMRAYTFFSSQEPCPMCMLRLITSGVGTICYVYRDAGSPDQGAMKSIDRLPPIWKELAQRQNILEAECSPELKETGRQAFLLSAPQAAEKIRNR